MKFNWEILESAANIAAAAMAPLAFAAMVAKFF